MSASGELFLQERDWQTKKEEHNQKIITWNRLILKKRLSKSTTKKNI